MQVDFNKHLFHFDNSDLPCPLKQYLLVTEKMALKQNLLTNESAFERVMEDAGKNSSLNLCTFQKRNSQDSQSHSGHGIGRRNIGCFVETECVSGKDVLEQESENCKNVDLEDLLPYGFAVHHSGMTRVDGTFMEDLFADGHVHVVVSTASLAWGVNLPVYTVIIKGVMIYSPEKGLCVGLSPRDVLKILDRTG